MTRSIIRVDKLSVFGRHGVLPEETRLGQRFLIDLCVTVDTKDAVATDEYTQAVCYASLCKRVVRLVEGEPVQLIETLADRIVCDLLASFPLIMCATVRVGKPGAPIPHSFEMVSVETTRERLLPVGFSLGCNSGNREAALRLAVTWLGLVQGLMIDAVSSLYRTAPWGGVDQPEFYNLCVVGRTSLDPHSLLRISKDIELRLGRVPGERWGQRAMDIDVLYLGDQTMSDPVLTLPHPLLAERAFVLVPLAEIASEQKISGHSVSDMLDRLPRQAGDVTPCAERHLQNAEDLK